LLYITASESRQCLVDVQNVTSTCAVGVNPISRLIQIQQAKKEKEPQFSLQSENGVARSREFVFQVRLREMSLCFSGEDFLVFVVITCILNLLSTVLLQKQSASAYQIQKELILVQSPLVDKIGPRAPISRILRSNLPVKKDVKLK